MSKSLIGEFKEIAKDPENAENIIKDPIFSTKNLTDPAFYMDQLVYVVKDAQQLTGETVVEFTGLTPDLVEPIGIIVPSIIILLYIYLLFKTLVKNVKAVAIITVIVVGLYTYCTVA